MRLVSAVLFVALTGLMGSAVLADEAKPADPKPEVTKKKVPYRVVKMLPETGQVLLFDKQKGNHVVAEVGQALDGFTVDEIDDDEVTLLAENGGAVILTAPPPPRQPKRAAKKTPAPVDPYADASETDATTAAGKSSVDGATAPVDPYAEPEAPKAAGEGGVRVASATSPSTATTQAPTAAPIIDAGPSGGLADPYADPGIAAFADAVGAPADAKTDAKAKPTKGKSSAKKPVRSVSASPDAAADLASAATGTPSPAPSAAPAPGTTILARAELDAALADFGKLAGSFRAAFTPDGLRFDAINDGTLLAKIGLRKGDVITSVDGQPLRSIDDAANLYARSSTVKNTTIQVTRAGKPVALRVAIQ